MYISVTSALAQAFATPKAKIARPILYTSGTGRGYGELDALERIAQAGMVQALAVEKCHPKSVLVFRLLWEGDKTMAVESLQTIATSWDRPSRRLDDYFCAAMAQRWSGRHLIRAPEWSMRRWGKQLECDGKTCARVNVALRQYLFYARNAGLMAMELALSDAGLLACNLPTDDDARGYDDERTDPDGGSEDVAGSGAGSGNAE